MSVMLALIACAFTFSACGDDDEEAGMAGAPYTGVWEAIHAEGVDEEEGPWSLDLEKGDVVLTLNEDKTFTWVDNVSDGGIFNDGTWEFKDNQLIVTKKTNTYVAQGIHDVISWSASTLKMKVWYHHKDPSDPDDYDEWVIFTFNKR